MISFNAEILSEAVQSYISKNLNTPISDLIFKGNPFSSIPFSEIINQIEAKNRCLKKLPTWYNGHNLYFPNKLNIEQTSSETTAKFKSELISGEHFIDLTGGFGVDDYYFSKRFNDVHHCDINDELSKIVVHNYFSACFKSLIKSSASSIPTLNLIKESTTPLFSLSCFGIAA